MKDTLLLLCFATLLLAGKAYSQNVGINTTGAAANSSAMLDVSATNKGVLIPQVSLVSLTDATTIASPATSLMVYNTNTALTGGAGYYYNSGTSASPVWTQIATGGQSAVSYYSTAAITVSSNAVTYVPGFPVTVNVPANSTVIVQVNCGAQTNSTNTTNYSIVDIIGIVDGLIPTNGLYQRLHVTNANITNNIRNASFAEAFTLSQGTHTFGVAGSLAGGNIAAVVGGNSASVLEATMTITILKN